MKKKLIGITLLCALVSCNENNKDKAIDNYTKIKDSIANQKAIDEQMAKGSRPDNEQESPSFEEEKANLLSSYNKIKRIDTLILDGKDSLKVHSKYYCLKDGSLVIPKKYLWGGDKSKDFVANTFVHEITIQKNKDTIFNKTITKSDFNKVINEEERKYATLFSANFEGYHKSDGGLFFGYSISIPLTDVGVAAYTSIDKMGKFKIHDQYLKIDKNKR